jgi:hypothetical protein
MNQNHNTKSPLPGTGCDCTAVVTHSVGSSCGCVSSCQTTSLARYDEDGKCADWGDISCETQWQIRDCLKVGFCEFIVCIADEFCPNGKFEMPVDEKTGEEKDLGDVLLCCLGSAVCSIAHCVPNAICVPKQNNDCIPPRPVIECNFAVEEKD